MASGDGAPSTFAAMQASLNAGARGSDLALSSDEEDAGRDARDDIDRALDEDRGGAKGNVKERGAAVPTRPTRPSGRGSGG
eukprot:CAMPEP_0119515602 /NCGR_PEP_ID=MMETSP1344-20130328/33038_1 /TAXON_ID=236787 /ORGANISM="Florenciella parvula, Strain CCMP2471" /LENGTH=80 /DNA_ID=CAMNT_0007553023 /DNA_START=117 /DNA_END=355 /DNA_ORIENTATION=+